MKTDTNHENQTETVPTVLTIEQTRACVDSAILWQRIDWRSAALSEMQGLLSAARDQAHQSSIELAKIKADLEIERNHAGKLQFALNSSDSMVKLLSGKLAGAKTGIELIAAERERQITAEGWTAAHDDGHTMSELACAAVAYTEEAIHQLQVGCGAPVISNWWPFGAKAWKPSPDQIRNLVKAGALIAAEIDHLSRKDSQDQNAKPS